MIENFLTKQFLGFLIAGGVAALLHWIIRIILSIWLPFSLAVISAYGFGIAIAFLLNSYFVFPNSNRPRWNQSRDFILINLAFSPVVWLASIYFNNWLKLLWALKYSQEIAHAFAITLPVYITFLIYKYFTFKET